MPGKKGNNKSRILFAVKGKRTQGVSNKNINNKASTTEEPKTQKLSRNRRQRRTNSTDVMMSKMAMVISHAHFHQSKNCGSYTGILKELCEKNNLPYVTPLDIDLDSRFFFQTLSEQCENLDNRVGSDFDSTRISSEKESNTEYESEIEEEKNQKEEDHFWQIQTRTQSRARQMKLRDLSQEREEKAKNQEPQPSTSCAESASN